MRRSISTLAAVARDRTLARVELAFFGFNMAETSTWIAILVYAYARGGASSAGIVAVILLVPAAAVAPLAAYASDRFRRDRVLVVEYLVQGVALAATSAALFADLHIAVLALAAVASAAFTFIRPTQGALLPAITRTPEDLTAANVVSGIVDGAARMVGPLVAGITLQVSQPATVFAIFAATSFVSAALVARLRVDAAAVEPRTRTEAPSVVRETLGGFRALRREHDARTIILLLASGVVVVGALDVLMVATAIDLLGLGQGWVGYLNAAFGVGGIVGAAASVTLIGRRRLTPALVAGAGAMGVPVAVVAATPSAVAAPVLFSVAGGGRSAADVVGRTLLQRVAPDDVLARVFGVLEGLAMLALAIGSVAASVLAETLGIRAALAVTGAFVPLVLLVLLQRLLRIDRHAEAPDAERLRILLGSSIFAPLAPATLERLARNLDPLVVTTGTNVIREGDAGDRVYLIVEGTADVSKDGEHVATLGSGQAFGEIALLRDVPRTATVTASSPMRLYALARAPFLEAVTGHPQSLRAADDLAAERMAVDSR
jgi:CRP-like cAMP-binding protein